MSKPRGVIKVAKCDGPNDVGQLTNADYIMLGKVQQTRMARDGGATADSAATAEWVRDGGATTAEWARDGGAACSAATADSAWA